MCTPGSPAAAPAPLPLMPPPAVAQMAGASEGNNRNDSAALAANRGRSSLRIDKTQSVPGATPGNGLNIPG